MLNPTRLTKMFYLFQKAVGKARTGSSVSWTTSARVPQSVRLWTKLARLWTGQSRLLKRRQTHPKKSRSKIWQDLLSIEKYKYKHLTVFYKTTQMRRLSHA